jgi:hypothetical protein
MRHIHGAWLATHIDSTWYMSLIQAMTERGVLSALLGLLLLCVVAVAAESTSAAVAAQQTSAIFATNSLSATESPQPAETSSQNGIVPANAVDSGYAPKLPSPHELAPAPTVTSTSVEVQSAAVENATASSAPPPKSPSASIMLK